MSAHGTERRAAMTVMEAMQGLRDTGALELGDWRYVPASAARHDVPVLARLCKHVGVYPDTGLFFPPGHAHSLFYGVQGAGLSTETKQLADVLRQSGKLRVIEVPADRLCDITKIWFPDLLFAMARCLVDDLLADPRLVFEPALLRPIWRDLTRITASPNGSAASGDDWSPWDSSRCGLGEVRRMLASFNDAIRNDAPCRAAWRSSVRSWSEAIGSFNVLIAAAEEELRRVGSAERIAFVVDGTDRLNGPAADVLFVHEIDRLSKLQALAVYAAPLEVRYGEGPPLHLGSEVLPLVRVEDDGASGGAAGRAVMKAMLLNRVDRSVFETGAEIDALVAACGGNPGELMRLLVSACEYADIRIDAAAVQAAIGLRASSLQFFLEPEDFQRLARIDRGQMQESNDGRAQQLLARLAMLEYGDGARRSHPVVRTLEGYRNAVAAL